MENNYYYRDYRHKDCHILPNVDLLPCPFCGSDKDLDFYNYSTLEGHSVRVLCRCGVEGKYYQKSFDINDDRSEFEKYRDLLIPIYQQAADFWNTRK